MHTDWLRELLQFPPPERWPEEGPPPDRHLWVELAAFPADPPVAVHRQVVVSPDPLVLYETQKVFWHSRHPFTILFTDRIPIEAPHQGGIQIQAKPDNGEGYTAEAKVRYDAASTKSYKYTVAVYDREADRVWMVDPEDPVEKDPRKAP